MPRAKTTKLYRTFVKGLITEAGYLTYPEDASVDELNTVLSRKGNRTRRLGINYENFHIFANNAIVASEARNEFVWKAVDNNPARNFLVCQFGRFIKFYDLTESPISDSLLLYTIDITAVKMDTRTNDEVVIRHCDFASGRGLLFIAHPFCETIVVEYNSDTNTFTSSSVTILMRDFDGLDDGLLNDEEPINLTKEHHYNLQNQGWVSANSNTTKTPGAETLSGYQFQHQYTGILSFGSIFAQGYQPPTAQNPIFIFQSKIGRYPGNNKQWWVARAEADDSDKNIKSGDFLPEVLNKLFSGNNRAPRGHYILNAFWKDRSAVSGISDIPIAKTLTRPSSVAFFSGRAWYGCESTVYYSQILDSKNKVGLCYQEADPTSEDISDLVPSDGGVIPIPEADSIVRLVPMANGMMVFAMNGVWFVSGGSGGFGATDISVDKVSSIGTSSPLSITLVDTTVFWWSEVGIQAIEQASGAFGPIPGKFGNTNIAEATIQSFYNNIDEKKKVFTKVVYDTKNNVIQWLYGDEDITDNYSYNRVLLYDVTLQSFYPWKFSSITEGPVISGVFLETGLLSQTVADLVVASGNPVSTIAGDAVITSQFQAVSKPTNITYVTVLGQSNTFSKVSNINYVDWESADGIGAEYESYVDSGFELLEDAMRRKQAIYVFCHFRRTEDDGIGIPSSCRFRVKWDWAANANSNKWSTEVEAYRPRVFIEPTTADTGAGFPVVISKNKVRGSGKSIQFRFSCSERGKNFDLLGWSVPFVGNTEA